jgi:hypothetical protein
MLENVRQELGIGKSAWNGCTSISKKEDVRDRTLLISLRIKSSGWLLCTLQ